MFRTILIGLFGVTVVMSMTTTKAPHHHTTRAHHTGHTHEPLEHENFKFFYVPHSHSMLVVTGPQKAQVCYIFALSDSEKASIHTDAGMRAVELKLLSTLSYASVTEMTKDQLNIADARFCGHVTHYYNATA